jgi:hypothetical protein
LTYHYRVVGSNSSGEIAGEDQTLTTLTAPPAVETRPASEITPRSARVQGTVNPNRAQFITEYYFEYGTTAAYGKSSATTTLCNILAPGCGGTGRPVSASLTGLEPDTSYHYRVVASSDFGANGLQMGADQTFITAPAPAAGASNITTRRATLKATINPRGGPATYHFNYGPTASYGMSTPETAGGTGEGNRTVSQLVTGLQPGTTYHVQVVTASSGVTRAGADGLFRTAPAPTAAVISPTSITTGAATLAAEIDTHGLTGSYHFDVSSLDSGYTHTTPEQAAPAGNAVQRVSAGVSGLPAGETFVVEITVSSNESIGVSDQITFATPPSPRVFPTGPGPDITGLYGCTAPVLDAYNHKPKAGEAISISGHDLGTGGTIILGDRPLTPTDWTPTRLGLTLPEDAAGTLALTVNCGHRSNTIAVAVFHKPDNGFSVTTRPARGQTATLSAKLPGPGKLQSAAANTKPTTTTVKKAGTVTIKAKLSSAGLRALHKAKNHRLTVALHVRFTPAGGQPATKTVTVTYKRTTAR